MPATLVNMECAKTASTSMNVCATLDIQELNVTWRSMSVAQTHA